MKLSKLYSNLPDYFQPIIFNDGLNVICAEIRLPEHTEEDTHNLGKSTVRDLINFGLLSRVSKDQTLFTNAKFKDFVFFLEIELLDKSFITIRRPVSQNTKISFKKHYEKNNDYSKLGKDDWDHFNLSHEKAKQLLDGLLNLSSISPYSFRKIIGYFIRAQTQYQDTFNLNMQSKHADWKPIVAKILGLNDGLIQQSYDLEKDLEELEIQRKMVISHNQVNNSGEVEGMLALKRNELESKQKELDSLDFSNADQVTANFLAKDIAKKIQEVNSNIYYAKANLERIEESISTAKIKFNVKDAEKIFGEAGIVFAEQIKKDYQQLLDFHFAIINERRQYLFEEKKELEASLDENIRTLALLNKQRADTLSSFNSMTILERYKNLATEIANLKSHINILENESEALHHAKNIQNDIRRITTELEKIKSNIEADIDNNISSTSTSTFATIRLYFNEIVNDVLAEQAVLNASLNQEFHLEFTAKLLDASGNKTSADRGHSYKKLLCIAFDLAVLKTYANKNFPHFVFHDGVFETLDDRKKENLLSVMRNLADLGIQQIITMIDSDTPKSFTKCTEWFSPNEIAVILHDDGIDGLLFKMTPW